MSTYVKFINLFPEIKGYIQEVQREFLTYFVWNKAPVATHHSDSMKLLLELLLEIPRKLLKLKNLSNHLIFLIFFLGIITSSYFTEFVILLEKILVRITLGNVLNFIPPDFA